MPCRHKDSYRSIDIMDHQETLFPHFRSSAVRRRRDPVAEAVKTITQNVKNPDVRMNQEPSRYFDATSEILQDSVCTCSDCGTAFCVSKRDHDTNQCVKCKDCDAAQETAQKSFTNPVQVIGSRTKGHEYSDKVTRIDKNTMEVTNEPTYEKSYKSVSGVNVNGFIFPKASELPSTQSKSDIVDSPQNLSTTTAQLSAQIMNLSYREFKESISQDQPEKVPYSTNVIFKRIKEAYDACSCKICECLTGQSVLPRIDNCGSSPCHCEPCNCKDCQDFLNGNKDLLDIGIDPRRHWIQNTNTSIEQTKRGFSNLDNQYYSLSNPCNCEPCRCKDCTKDFLNFKNDYLMRYTTKTNTALERLRNGYNNLTDNPTSEYSACNCEPCECKDCQRDRLNFSIDAHLKSKKRTSTETQQINGDFFNSTCCNCKPCDCIKCAKSHASSCDCKPCECYDCKSMRGLGKKTVIVAPVEEGAQRADCVCSPCACARCAHRGVDMYPNRVHEMSTGINRHPNCHCEACANDACEPNGTGSCRCEGRHGVISKPVENNPHDFDIRRSSVSSKPLKTLGNRFVGNTFVAMNMNKFPSGTGFERQHCRCSVCECIVCKCKKNDLSQSKSSQNVNDSLRTLKLPSRELKSCQCDHCECQYCALKKQGNLVESVDMKKCTCEKCDCIHCEGELKPRHTLSKLIPVMDGSKDACRCKPCECIDCNKMEAQRLETSREAIYPIKKGEILTPSIIRKDPLSEPELLRQSSEYTQIKHSMAQSNVFNASKLPERSQQNFSIYHMYPENNLNKKFNYPVAIATTASEQYSQKTKSRSVKIFDPMKEKRLYRNNCPSTSRAVPRREISIIRINTILNHQRNDENEQSYESPFFEDMVPISKISRTPSMLSIPQSAHNLVYLTPNVSYGETSDQLSIPSPKWNSKIHIKSLHDQNENNDEKHSSKLKESRCHLCGSISTKSEIITCDEIIQTSLNFTYYSGDNNDFEDPVLKHSDHPKELRHFSSAKYEIACHNDVKYGLKREYYTCRVENANACSYGSSDEDRLFDERALKTLKRAKEFSFELVTLLQQYDKANKEFVSVTKKLKESHELILNDFKNYVCGRIGDRDDVNYLTRSSILSNNEHLLIDANPKKSSNDWKELKEVKKNRLDTTSLTASVINSLSGQRIYMIKNQSSDQFNNRLTSEHKNKESAENLSHKVNNTIELNGKEVIKCQGEYKAYEKLVKRSFNHLKKLNDKNSLTAKYDKDNMQDVMTTSVSTMIEVDLLKSFIRQEVHNVLKELNVNYSSCENNTNHEVLEKEKPANIKQKELTSTKSPLDSTLDKPSVKGKGSTIYANQHETMVVSKSPSPMQQSSSHRRHLALMKLQNEVKELINQTRIHSTSARKVHSSSKETDRHSRGQFDTKPSSGISKADEKKSLETAQNVKCAHCEGLRVSLQGLRRVSDHTVMVKWRAPPSVNEVKGFEVLVDGKPIDKQFGPSDRMAVVTCLPQARVALAVRAVPRRAPACDHRLLATLIYRPREK